MIPVLAGWLAFAAIGAGTVHLALVVEAPWVLAPILAVVGGVELAWGVAVLALPRPPTPRLALVVALGAVTGGAALASASIAPLALEALLLASLLDAVAALLLAVRFRRGGARSRQARSQRAPLGALALLTAGALGVAAVVTPALAAAPAGRSAQPHGEHVVPELGPAGGHPEHPQP